MTTIEIDGEDFLIDGRLTYPGRTFQGHRIEGLLLNSRMVQATFDDRNPETVGKWAYPDGSPYDPDRQTAEFIDALPSYREHGLTGVTVDLQGGNPRGYQTKQVWLNSAFEPDGTLRQTDAERMRRCIEACDASGIVVILGVFYFGQDQLFPDEKTVIQALDRTVSWVLDHGWRNVLIEVANECDNAKYTHPILQPGRVHELVDRVRGTVQDGRRLLVGVSYCGGVVPGPEVVEVSDFVLFHGNGVGDPGRISQIVDEIRAVPTYRPMPIVNNEDDHFAFDKPENNFLAALSRHASWGYFDPGQNNYRDGYQSPPTNWAIDSSDLKRSFFTLLREMTGGL